MCLRNDVPFRQCIIHRVLRRSHLAEGLRQWMPHVIQAVSTVLSSDDLRKGGNYAQEVIGAIRVRV
jgi:hypothetical protein